MAIFRRKKKENEEIKKDDSKKSQDLSSKEKGAGVKMKDLYKSDSKNIKEDRKKDEKKDSKKEVSDKVVSVKKEVSGKGYKEAYRILVKPLVTEKVSNMGEQNKYAFEVALNTNKIEVMKAIEGVYGVRPEKVSTIRLKGKKVRMGTVKGKRKDWKKAIITLPKGKNINVYEGI